VDGQACPIQVDVNGQIKTSGGGGGGSNVNITGINGTAPALTNALPVELSDGTNALGTSGNPVRVDPTGTTAQPVNARGNAGAAFDAPATGTAPANVLYQGIRGATTFPTAGTDGQIVAEMGDKAGRPVMVLNTPRDLVGAAVVSNNSSASGVSFIAAGATGVFNDIITFVATNRSTSATIVTLTDGTASYTFALAANGGIVINFPTPLPATSTATAWTIGNSATVACDYMAVFAKNK
jgi:hypothetical protein